MKKVEILIFSTIVFQLILLTSCSSVKPQKIFGWEIIRPPKDVCTLVRQKDIIWAGGSEGVYKIDRKKFKVLEKINTTVNLENVKALLTDSKENLWVAHENGLLRYSENGSYNYTVKDGLPDNRVNALALGSNDEIWIGTWSGAACKKGTKWQKVTKKDGLKVDMVNAILYSKTGNLWFGSYIAPRGGISVQNLNKWQYFNGENGLAHTNITALYEDNQGQVWASSGLAERGGVNVFGYDQNQWKIIKTFHKKDGLAGEKGRSLFQDKDSSMWIGSEYDGVSLEVNGRFKVITMNDGLSDNEVKSIIQDQDGNMWLGTRDGITVIKYEVLSNIKEKKN